MVRPRITRVSALRRKDSVNVCCMNKGRTKSVLRRCPRINANFRISLNINLSVWGFSHLKRLQLPG